MQWTGLVLERSIGHRLQPIVQVDTTWEKDTVAVMTHIWRHGCEDHGVRQRNVYSNGT